MSGELGAPARMGEGATTGQGRFNAGGKGSSHCSFGQIFPTADLTLSGTWLSRVLVSRDRSSPKLLLATVR